MGPTGPLTGMRRAGDRPEFFDNGYRVAQGSELRELKSDAEVQRLLFRVKAAALWDRRAVLLLGMLLRDSEVAKEDQRVLGRCWGLRLDVRTLGLADRRQDLVCHPALELASNRLPTPQDQGIEAGLVDDVDIRAGQPGVITDDPSADLGLFIVLQVGQGLTPVAQPEDIRHVLGDEPRVTVPLDDAEREAGLLTVII